MECDYDEMMVGELEKSPSLSTYIYNLEVNIFKVSRFQRPLSPRSRGFHPHIFSGANDFVPVPLGTSSSSSGCRRSF